MLYLSCSLPASVHDVGCRGLAGMEIAWCFGLAYMPTLAHGTFALSTSVEMPSLVSALRYCSFTGPSVCGQSLGGRRPKHPVLRGRAAGGSQQPAPRLFVRHLITTSCRAGTLSKLESHAPHTMQSHRLSKDDVISLPNRGRTLRALPSSLRVAARRTFSSTDSGLRRQCLRHAQLRGPRGGPPAQCHRCAANVVA